MKLHDLEFELYLSEKEITAKVKKLAKQINNDYNEKSPLFIPILNGAFIFASDLIKQIDLNCNISFVKVASYSKMESTGNLKELIGINENVFDRDIIIIEDIVDSGKTIDNLINKLTELGPKSVELASLLLKKDNLETPLNIKYLGFEIPDKFVVGYGLDYDGLGRNLPSIYQVKS